MLRGISKPNPDTLIGSVFITHQYLTVKPSDKFMANGFTILGGLKGHDS